MLLGINIIGSVRTRVALCLQITAFARACAAAAYSNSRTHYFSQTLQVPKIDYDCKLITENRIIRIYSVWLLTR